MAEYDGVVVGAGPNGLAAAITLAQKGLKMLVLEAAPTPGGGARTLELTLPGYRHDVCSAIHPIGCASPFFNDLGLARHGLEWIHPTYAAAHALDGESPLLHRSLEATAQGLGRDAGRYRAFFGAVVENWSLIDRDVLGPLGIPSHPIAFGQFCLRAPWPARPLLQNFFRTPEARALIAGVAAHSTLPLDFPPSLSVGLVLTLIAHTHGWPLARGGSQSIIDALVAELARFGGEVRCGVKVKSLAELPPSRCVLLDLTPRQLLELPEFAEGGDWALRLYRWQLRRFRQSPGSFKIDYALNSPIPWRDARLGQAGTVHLGGTLDELAEAEAAVWRGHAHPRPYVLVAQQSQFDASRAPQGQHTAWAYCHVPHGYQGDATEALEGQLERFAPGFRDCVLARHTHTPAQLQAYNANYVGGDISGGALLLHQLFTRPVIRANPYSTPLAKVFLCSSSTPPGGGVLGMCGFHAARAALRSLR